MRVVYVVYSIIGEDKVLLDAFGSSTKAFEYAKGKDVEVVQLQVN